MENNANLSDGARQADNVSSEHAETMFSADQAETNMVKLVDGKLTPMGDTEDDVSDDMPRIRLGSDEERTLTGDLKKKYETSEAGQRASKGGMDPEAMPDNPIAVAEITGNPDAGADVETGLSSESATGDQTQAGGDRATSTSMFDLRGMIPPTPGTPDPNQPIPGVPETPPTPPSPGPEIPELPGQPKPAQPEIEEPSEPDRSHEINADWTTAHRTDGLTYTATVLTPKNVSSEDEGMEENPDTGESAHPYDVDAKDTADYQPGERPEEKKEAEQLPRELMDESSITAQEMLSDNDRSDEKSTDGLDRTYNDPKAARDMAT